MIIAVNTRFLLKGRLDGVGYFIKEVFSILTQKYPQHTFYFLFDRPYDKEFVFSSNIRPLVVSPPARMSVLWKYWFDIKVPLVLNKIRADVFVSPDGYCSLTTRRPQCIVVHDLGYLHFPAAYKKIHVRFLRAYMPKFLRKARSIAAVSAFTKEDITKQYKIEPEKINVVFNGVKDIFRPFDPDDQQSVREEYTGGQSYFICVGTIQPRKNIMNLLKAFSIFKKRQQTGMKLVLAGQVAWKSQSMMDLLKTYKYREDVVITGYLEEPVLARLLGAAYALVYPSWFEGFGVPILEAMRARVPVLTSRNTSMQEIASDAALYFDPHQHLDIADKMMKLYKDEDLRHKLIEKGQGISAPYTWERSSALLWDSIMQACK